MNFKEFFRIIIQSFYSVDLYMDVISKWQHWGLKFLLRFSVLITLIASIIIFTMIATIDFNNESVKSLLDNIPELKIYNDKASFVNPEIKSPVHIQPPKSVLNVIIIDLDTSDADKYKNDSLVVFVSDRIVFNLVQDTSMALPYKDLLFGTDVNIIDGAFLLKFLDEQQRKVLGIIIFVGIPLGSLVYFALTLLKVTFYSSIASLVSMIFKLNLTFKQLTRMGIIANIPSVIVSSISSILFFRSVGSDGDQFLVTSVGVIYFVGAIIIYLKKTIIEKN